MDFLLNGTSYGGGAAIGVAEGYKKGFVATFGEDFGRDFTAGSSLQIYRGETLVDQLSLKGTAAGMAMVRRCLAAIRADKSAAQREKQRYAHIADDPFAVKQTEMEKLQFGVNSAKPRSLPAAWVSDADYPSAAQRERRQGVTGYKLEVNADGQATSCIVTSSSGHPDLDEAACRLIPRRARFSTGGLYESKVTWRLPE
ncbi:TonB family protein [Sphingobium terrigena]|uniref:TonB family protein n=2 Tax=Sphingobium terrigena TaxID=2304063 RepID=A0A418YLG1_9SPHN|nr:TonB family protein [Sphingobium terrigena]